MSWQHLRATWDLIISVEFFFFETLEISICTFFDMDDIPDLLSNDRTSVSVLFIHIWLFELFWVGNLKGDRVIYSIERGRVMMMIFYGQCTTCHQPISMRAFECFYPEIISDAVIIKQWNKPSTQELVTLTNR